MSKFLRDIRSTRHHLTRNLALSKLAPPAATRFLVVREQILQCVQHAVGAKLVLIRGPAGFGKTTVMLQLREHYEREGIACAWINLDDADNDAGRLLSYLGYAMNRVLDDTPSTIDDSAADAGFDAVLDAETIFRLVDRLAAHHGPFLLFLDEFECLHNASVLGVVTQLIDRLPVGAQVVIGSRSVADIGLARLRARDQVVEIDAGLLRFTSEETREFLCRLRGLTLAPAQVQRLHHSTEGWATALWLASLALERRSDSQSFIDGFAGSNATIADYLAEDVFTGLDGTLQEFLLKTSVLDQLCAPLCDAVCECDDSAARLSSIERANLFLVRVDEDRGLYRYHSLFGDFLRAYLRTRRPQWLQPCHLAAARWYLDRQQSIPAIDHAFASGEMAFALKLLERHADGLFAEGRLRPLVRWCDVVPAREWQFHGDLASIYVVVVAFIRGAREALKLLDQFESELMTEQEFASTRLDAFRPMLFGMCDYIDEAYSMARQQEEPDQADDAFRLGLQAQTLANCSMMLGRFSEAKSYADHARRAHPGVKFNFQLVLSNSVESAIDLMQGSLRQATARLRDVVGDSHRDLANFGRNIFAGVLFTETLYDAGDIAQAERLLNVYVPLVRDQGIPDQLISAHLLLARIRGDRGDDDRALELLEELEVTGHRLAIRRVVASSRLERARHYIMRGNVTAAEEQLQRCGALKFWRTVEERCFFANDVTTRSIGRARIKIRSGHAGRELTQLRQQVEIADAAQRHRRALKLRILLAEALQASGKPRPALRIIRQAVEFAAAEGFTQTFVEEGAGVRALLQELLYQREDDAGEVVDDLSTTHLRRLIQCYDSGRQQSAEPAAGPLVEALTRKESEVLELLADGCSNQAIADALLVSESTVRTHLRNINVKLQASSRTQAIVIARRLNLVG